jgi:SAM-dependent methyltransferase
LASHRDVTGFIRRARCLLGLAPSPPSAAHAARERAADERAADVLRRTEEFNRNAETYWRDVKDDPAGRRHVLNRPLGNVGEAAHALYRLGIVLAELRPGLGHTVLDFAAGSGWLSLWLNRLGCRTIALDVSPTALELARELFALDARQRPELRPEFLAYDGRRIPLPDESVDRVVSFDGFHHVPNPEQVLRELARVLRPGGLAVFAEPGEGHAHAEASRLETEKAGVLENELDVASFARWAECAGFSDVRLKPYADPGSIRLAPEDYLRLQAGDDARFPMDALRESLRQFFLFVLAKGEPRFDSRAPNLLRAEIQTGAAGTLRGPGRGSVVLPVRVRNTGDTLWLHEPNALGGYVMLGGHLHSARGDRVVRGAFRTALPGSVGPGQSVEFALSVPLPAELGRYVVELDLVDENVAWFGQTGSATTRIDVEVERLAEADEPDAWRLRRAGDPRDSPDPRRQHRPANLAGSGRARDRAACRAPAGRRRRLAGAGLPAHEPPARRAGRRDHRAGGALPRPARARDLPAQARHGARAGLLVRAARVAAACARARRA